MDDYRGRSAQIDLLRRLNPIELFVLSERCRGLTSSEIGAALDVTDEVAMMYLGNVYDKLGVTYQHTGTSMGRLMAFCPALQDIDAPPVPVRSEINPHAEPPPHHPSERSLDLVDDDDRALLAQRGDGGVVPPGNRGWIYGLAAAAAILLVAILAIILLLSGDDDEDSDATATALAALASPTVAEFTATPGETPPPEATATEAATDTPEPSPTEEPTQTPEPSPTETVEPTATETPELTPTEEATPTQAPEQPTPPPPPQPGDQVFAADWTEGPGDWELGEGWTVDEALLIGEGPDAEPLMAPFDPDSANYAIEAVMAIENVDGCDELAGLFGRVNPQGPEDDQYPAGYVGGVCDDEWRISAVSEQENELDELGSGDVDIDNQPHTYRLEIVGDRIRLFMDGQFLGEATDDRYVEPGQVGLFLTGDMRATIEQFRVIRLQGP